MKKSVAKELAFFGRITAGFTHEMKNILAIIKESAGLMEDLLLLTRDDPFPHWERFSHRVSVIQQQVQRGVDLAGRLNRFAHGPDEPVARVDLNELVEQMSRLSERFARLKEVTLKASPADSAVALLTAPVELQLAVFTMLESCWNQMPAGGEIELKVERRGEHPCLVIECSGEIGDSIEFERNAATAASIETAREVLQGIGGKILQEQGVRGFAILFAATEE